MAKCPNCQKEVSFIHHIFDFSNYWDNLRRNRLCRIYDMFTYNNCKCKLSITEASSGQGYVLVGISYAFVVLIVIIAQRVEYLKVFTKIPFVILLLFASIPIYLIWWRYLAELREPYE